MAVAELVPWFQIASTIIAGIGIITSVSLGIASLNNNRTDRLIKISPNLLFNVGGQELAATLQPLKRIPGVATGEQDVEEFLAALPDGYLAPFLEQHYGQLYNHGAGPGLSVEIWFQAERLTVKGQERSLTRNERESLPYIKTWNMMSAIPANVPPGGVASFGTLPICVLAAHPDVTTVTGNMYIECHDQHGRSLQWSQPTTYFIDRLKSDKATITVAFSQRPVSLT
ncbi:hypothetical protein C9413_30630 [Rhizobium sp. SEMIA 4085]|uniref:hypothetical protein n=1 Tax=Rhizobium sp. SEMIA 4085 TaxID=2137761 RepID=UPI0014797AA8|nr:hypothetical protein [Rhizobium sp. SEMIA 4085]NNH33584.1 hypothetical protein [Rhizobium sp. SEMIA 4085]